MFSSLISKWNKRHLLILVAVVALALYFFGSQENLPNSNFLRPIGYLCLGFSGLLTLINQ